MRKFLFLTIFCLLFSLVGLANIGISSSGLPLKPTDEAAVKVGIDGMCAVFFGAEKEGRVSIGLLDVHHHTPLLQISKVKNGIKSTSLTLKGHELADSLYIAKTDSQEAPHRYFSDDQDQNDSRWLMDFNELHQQNLSINESRLMGKIHFQTGLFYADKLTATRARFVSADNPGVVKLNRKIGMPAAKIQLEQGEVLTIKNRTGEIARLKGEENVRFEIEITNLPPADMGAMDHFLNYYSLINEKLVRYVPAGMEKVSFRPEPLECGPGVFTKITISE